MDQMPDEEQLIGLEARRLAALVAGDMAIAEALHADDYELITPGAATYSKREYLDAIAARHLRYDVFEAASPVRVRVHGDTAILRYQARIKIAFGRNYEATLAWHTDYWERREGRWQAVWSQATGIP